MKTGDDDTIDPRTAELAEQVRRKAGLLPGPDEIRGLAEEAARHGGPGMNTEETRQLTNKAIDRAEQVTELLRQLSGLLDGDERDGDRQ